MAKLIDAIKALFATTKTTGTHLPLVASDGTPEGVISTANLASVLGVTMFGGTVCPSIKDNEDLNDYLAVGAYRCVSAKTASTLTNSPTNNTGFLLWVLSAYGSTIFNYGIQIALMHTGRIKVRFCSKDWSDWENVSLE